MTATGRPASCGSTRPACRRSATETCSSGSGRRPSTRMTGTSDEVFGAMSPLGTLGSLAEYVRLRQDAVLAAKPTRLTFEQAAAVPLAACTALQAVRDKGRTRPGQRVLVNGAAG